LYHKKVLVKVEPRSALCGLPILLEGKARASLLWKALAVQSLLTILDRTFVFFNMGKKMLLSLFVVRTGGQESPQIG